TVCMHRNRTPTSRRPPNPMSQVLHEIQPRLTLRKLGPAALLRTSIDPAVAIGALVACVLGFEGRFDGSYLILALLVFPMTSPNSLSHNAADPAALLRNVFAGWLTLVGLLILVGWVSGKLYAFDQRVILAWLVATPLAL